MCTSGDVGTGVVGGVGVAVRGGGVGVGVALRGVVGGVLSTTGVKVITGGDVNAAAGPAASGAVVSNAVRRKLAKRISISCASRRLVCCKWNGPLVFSNASKLSRRFKRAASCVGACVGAGGTDFNTAISDRIAAISACKRTISCVGGGTAIGGATDSNAGS